MLKEMKWQMLQLFADGGDGGSGTGNAGAGSAETGVSAADAGQQRLRELGVPENRIRKNRAYRVPAQTAQKAAAPSEGQEPGQAAAAESTPPAENAQNAAPRMSWEEISKDPEYSKQIQSIVQARVRQSKASEEALGKLTPALELLAKKHGQDPAKIDYDALAKSIMDDKGLYSDKALELDVPDEVAKQLVQQNLELDRYRRMEQNSVQQQKFQQHLARLEQQGQALKAQFPGFDLRSELQNPVFERMTRPDSGLTVEDAYYAVHRKDIQQAQAQVIASQTAQQISNSIQANAKRPNESGAGQAPSAATFDYRKASLAEREALKKRIRAAGARGEKIYPGR